MPVSSAANLWEQSLLAIAVDQPNPLSTDLPQSRASFAPTDFASDELLADRQWIGGWAFCECFALERQPGQAGASSLATKAVLCEVRGGDPVF